MSTILRLCLSYLLIVRLIFLGKSVNGLCHQVIDASFSRAAALADSIRGSSLIDVEPRSAFPAAFIDQNKVELLQGQFVCLLLI